MTTTKEILKEAEKKREAIIAEYSVGWFHNPWSFAAFTFSAVISTFGIYPILKTTMSDATSLGMALTVFIVILMIVDTIKRKYLVKSYNAQIRKDIFQSYSPPSVGNNIWRHKIVFLFAVIFILVFDTLGMMATADYALDKYNNSEFANTMAYKSVQAKVEDGKLTNKNFNMDLAVWLQSKKDNEQNCKDAYSKNTEWFLSRRSKCNRKWENENPRPIRPQVVTTMTESDVKKIEAEKESFITEFGWYIFFGLGWVLAVFLQYTTFSSLQDDYEDVRNTLTSDTFTILSVSLDDISAGALRQTKDLVIRD